MSCGGRLKDNEIFNEITNASDEDNCSENESKNHNSLRKKNISARTNVLKNKGCQSESSSDTEYSKIKLTKETQQNEGRLIRKRKAQKGDSDAKPSKISCDSHRSTFIESPKASTPKRENRSEDDLPNEVYYPSKSSSPTKSSAKKNLFSYRNKSSEVLKGFKINLIDCQSPTKQKKDSQNDKENKAHSSTKKIFGKNDKTPNKKLVSGDNLKSEKDIKTESPIENKLTPLKQTETPTKQSSIGLHGTYERGSRTPSKNKVGSTYFKGLEESKISNELSPTKRSCETLSPSKNVSKPNSDAKSNDLYSKTKTPQKQIKNYTERELQRLNIDCNPSVYEVPSPVRKNKSSFSKTTTPLKHEDNENVINTPKKSLRKDFKKEIENYETECLTSCKNEFQSSGVKGSSLSSAVKHEVRKQNVMSPLQRKEITVTTPVSKKKSGRGFLTPSMMKKEHVNTNGKTNDDLDTTRKQLHISTVPKSLPCRDAEFDQIKSFLIRKIEHCAGGCMYISGVPGTGKTATVHAVVRSLQLEADSGDLPDFDFVEVNGLRLTEPKQAYVRILQTLTDKKLSPDQAQQLLNKRFSGSCKKSTIILVDELDYLCNRRQDVVYNILDWPTKQGSGLVVLTISNTMDLPERTLKGRVTSRMGLTRVTFQPYSHHQLKTIVEDRLSGTNTFHPDAVQLVARKVAAVSGDARRALDICRRTTEQVMHGEQVTVSHVERALTQIFSGPRVSVIQSLCREGQLVLRAIRDVNQRTGVDEATVTQVYKHLWEICLVDGCPRPTVGGMLQTCVSLVALGLIVAEKGRVDITRKMSLNVSSDDIHFALDNIKV